MVYLDASALVPLYAAEPMSARVNAFLAQAGAGVAASSWTLVECVSAFAIKARVGALSAADAATFSREVQQDAGAVFDLEQVQDRDCADASLLIQRCPTPLRAGDALHLAICLRPGGDLLTLDQEMAIAAQALGIALVQI